MELFFAALGWIAAGVLMWRAVKNAREGKEPLARYHGLLLVGMGFVGAGVAVLKGVVTALIYAPLVFILLPFFALARALGGLPVPFVAVLLVAFLLTDLWLVLLAWGYRKAAAVRTVSEISAI